MAVVMWFFFQTSHLASVDDDGTAINVGSRLYVIIDRNLRDGHMIVPMCGAFWVSPSPSPTTLVLNFHGARVRWRRTTLVRNTVERRATDS